MLTAVVHADEPMHHQAGPHTHSTATLSGSLESFWQSRYVSEGTDNLRGAGILSELLTVQWGRFHTDLWQGIGYDTNFAEFNGLAVVDFHLGTVEAYVSYNHKRFFNPDDFDNEIGAGLVYDALPAGLFLALDAYYSFGLDGTHVEFSVGAEHVWRRLTLRPILKLGANAGYLDNTEDGLRSLVPRLDVSSPLAPGVSLVAYGAYNLPLGRSAESFFWAGIGVKMEF